MKLPIEEKPTVRRTCKSNYKCAVENIGVNSKRNKFYLGRKDAAPDLMSAFSLIPPKIQSEYSLPPLKFKRKTHAALSNA